MHVSSLCACTHMPNVIPSDVIVRAVNVLVVLVATLNAELFVILKRVLMDKKIKS